MCTFLGTAGKISEDDIDKTHIESSEITFLEGYLWDEGELKKAFDKAINLSKRVLCLCQINFVLKDTKSIFKFSHKQT